ncbi:hypothetical protein JCM12296A_59920 [Desulfosarcina cetonica]|uniref:hypothetical protein n=1 Tax=Desulfosarcina cetonica TaxID=90730 RepID=UPI0006D22C8E|nr:hypothetical protein [Desulfosarcina cetonica]
MKSRPDNRLRHIAAELLKIDDEVFRLIGKYCEKVAVYNCAAISDEEAKQCKFFEPHKTSICAHMKTIAWGIIWCNCPEAMEEAIKKLEE